MSIEEKKKRMFASFKKAKALVNFDKKCKSSFSQKLDGFTLEFEDSTNLRIYISQMSNEYPAGTFGATSGFALSKGPIFQNVQKKLGSRTDKIEFFKSRIVSSSSSRLVPEREALFPSDHYVFDDVTPAEELTQKIIDDFATHMLPIVSLFIDDYSGALDYILTTKNLEQKVSLSSPFLWSLSLLNLAERSDSFSQLNDLAKGSDDFFDYQQVHSFANHFL